MTINLERERAAVAHVRIAEQLVKDNSDDIGTVSNEQIAVLLGRLIRGVDELNTRLETIELLLDRKP